LWIGGKKVLENLANTIYEIARVASVKQYWTSKDHVTTESFPHNHREAIGKAMSKSSRSRCTFISRHTVGM
jgi:hypothetical protein